MEKEHYDHIMKFIIIGNANTGKSCLLYHFLEGKGSLVPPLIALETACVASSKRDSNHTIGVEFGAKGMNINSKSIKLQIWDTAGQERFRSVARNYYRGALGAVVLYDMTSPESFQALEQWIKDARELARMDICILIVGNKSDLKAKKLVQTSDAAKFAQNNGVDFIETSAFTGENVNECFKMLTSAVLSKIESGQMNWEDDKKAQQVLTPQTKPSPKDKKTCGSC